MKFNLSEWIYRLEHSRWHTQGCRYVDVSHYASSGSLSKVIGHGRNKNVITRTTLPSLGKERNENECNRDSVRGTGTRVCDRQSDMSHHNQNRKGTKEEEE